MREVEPSLSRLPSTRALIAGAALLAGSISASAAFTGAAGEETAFVNPRIAPSGNGLDGAALPQPLAPSDAARLRRIFALQSVGHIAEAAAEMSGLSDPVLNGHVLAQRYLGRHTQPNSAELAAWLARYPDHPDAPAIHELLLKRLGASVAATPAPTVARLDPDPPEAAAPEEDQPAGANLSRNPLLEPHGARARPCRPCRERLGLAPAHPRAQCALWRPASGRNRPGAVHPGPRRRGAAHRP